MRDRKVRKREGLGERIRALRGARSRDCFAGELGIHKNTLARYELGQRVPDAAVLKRLCRVAQVQPEWLLDGEEAQDDGFVAPPVIGATAVKPVMQLHRDWLKAHRLDAGALCVHVMKDHSMAPAVEPGDVLLVERGSPLPPRDGALVLARLDGQPVIRRARHGGEGQVRLECDADAAKADALALSALEAGGSHELIGRVCWHLGRPRQIADG